MTLTNKKAEPTKRSNALFLKNWSFAFAGLVLVILVVASFSSCGIYSFSEKGTVPDSVKTVRVNYIENKASYVNPQLSPNLSDRLRQKIVNQTRLTNTNKENAHYDIKGYISDYSVSTTGVSSNNGQQQSSVNRLTVSVHITLLNQLSGQPTEFDVSRSFDFSATQSLQTAEASLLDEMIRNLTDEIFNRIFSNW